MKNIIIILCIASIALFVSCSSKEEKTETTKKSDLTKLEIPKGYKLLVKSDGDLDGDKEDERIYVYNTDKKTDNGYERIIYICKKENKEWMLWKEIKGPALPSGKGGKKNDPFNDLLIDNGMIYIIHNLESTDQWYYNHCYKLVDKEFKLVEAVVDYGRPCAKWETYIYNLETGDLKYELAPDVCDDVLIDKYVIAAKKDYKIENPVMPMMQGFIPGANKLEIPDKDKRIIYY